MTLFDLIDAAAVSQDASRFYRLYCAAAVRPRPRLPRARLLPLARRLLRRRWAPADGRAAGGRVLLARPQR